MSVSVSRGTTEFLLEDAGRVLSRVSLAPLRGRRLLITGASGLLGTHLLASLAAARSFQALELELFAVVRNDLPVHLEPLLAGSGFRVLRGNLTDEAFRRTIPEVDAVIHASSYAQPALFMADPIETLALGTAVTLDLLRLTRPGGSFLFISSSEVYSGRLDPPFSESQIGTTTPNHPRACYIESKRAGEAICHAFRARGIGARIARVSLAYGPGTRRGDQRVLNTFIEAALTRGEITMRDPGRALRTYAYVTDVVEVLWDVLLRGSEAVYNVGGESTTSVAALAQMIGVLTSAKVTTPHTAGDSGGAPEDVRLDLSRSRTEFGKTQYVPLIEGVSRTIAWQRFLYATP
jgi:nucleoside-diphosphate-sugar epimerase